MLPILREHALPQWQCLILWPKVDGRPDAGLDPRCTNLNYFHAAWPEILRASSFVGKALNMGPHTGDPDLESRGFRLVQVCLPLPCSDSDLRILLALTA